MDIDATTTHPVQDTRERHPALVLCLSLLTCGIYGFVWLWQVETEIKQELGREDLNPTLDVLLCVVTFGLWGVYLAYRMPRDIADVQRRRGASVSDLSIVSLILAVTGFWFVSVALCQHELNLAWRAHRDAPPAMPAIAAF
jgi:uncharacterized protein DUF4234